MELGTVHSAPGTTASGWLDVAGLPTGGSERLPVTIAEGEADGPTLWVTAAIHGDEVTGIAAAQDVLTADVVADLRGTVVCVPILNPAGVRATQRTSYYHGEDPNRYFPYGVETRASPPEVQERINERVFELVETTADALISLHEGWINESCFTIVERVRYGADRTRAEAEALAAEMTRLAAAFGLPIVREFDVDVQEAHGLERSFECSAVNRAGIPALTPELGSPLVVEDGPLEAAITGIHNVMRALGMLPGDPVPNANAPVAPVSYPVKRVIGPVTPVAGIVRHRVDAGDVVAPGDPIADVTTPHGDVEATVEADAAGYVLGRRHGVGVYENDHLVSMAALDEGPLVVERGERDERGE